MHYIYSGKTVELDGVHTVFEVDIEDYLLAARMAHRVNEEKGWGGLPGGCFYEKSECDTNVYITVPLDTEPWPEPPVTKHIEVGETTYKGCTIEVEQEEDPWSPREDCDGLGTMFCKHGRYSLGDKDAVDPRTIVNYKPSDFKMDCSEDSEEWNEFMGYYDPSESTDRELDETAMERELIMFPLWLYDHSQLSMSTGRVCQWDSSFVGWIYARKEKAKEEQMTIKQMQDYMLGEIETYDKYLRGEVYRFEITDEDDEHVESCGGWYDDHEGGMMSEIEATIDHHIVWKEKERVKAEAERLRVETISYVV